MKTNEKAVLILSIFCWLNKTCTEFFTFFFDGQGCSLLFFFLIPFELVVFTGFYLVFLLLSLEVGRPMSGSEKRALPIGQSDGPVLERTALETISTSVVEKRYRFKKIR